MLRTQNFAQNISEPISFMSKDSTKEMKELASKIDEYDQEMINYLVRLYNSLNGETLNIENIHSAVDVLAKFDEKQQYKYLENLLHPEYVKGGKIPSPIPVPSTSFQLHNSVTVSTNASGNLLLLFNPYFLYNTNSNLSWSTTIGSSTYNVSPTFLSTFYVNNNNNLDGHTVWNDSTFTPINIGQGIPGVYSQYRVVSASIVVKYIGRLDIASGVIGGAIVFDERRTVGGYYNVSYNSDGSTTFNGNLTNSQLSKYSNFDLAMDSFYHQENLALQGIRELYFPLDNSYEEYIKLFDNTCCSWNLDDESTYTKASIYTQQDYFKSGFNQMIYVLGAPASSACFKVDIYINFETLPNAEFLNYMPITPSCPIVSQREKQESIMIVQKKPIMKVDESDAIVKITPKQSLWDRIKNKFKGSLPGIGKMALNGLANFLPGLKPGLTLASALLSGNSNIPTLGNPSYVKQIDDGNATAKSTPWDMVD